MKITLKKLPPCGDGQSDWTVVGNLLLANHLVGHTVITGDDRLADFKELAAAHGWEVEIVD